MGLGLRVCCSGHAHFETDFGALNYKSLSLEATNEI